MNNGLFARLHYALGEAILNSRCAQEMETREGIKDEYEEDIQLFQELRDEIMEELFVEDMSNFADEL